jgi:hypothetical protein
MISAAAAINGEATAIAVFILAFPERIIIFLKRLVEAYIVISRRTMYDFTR